ncbi:MAG: type II secretion system F family protein [Phycisphaerae bacterium]|nr:type II secretion system F family protein [Phycisphaerae bacterium]
MPLFNYEAMDSQGKEIKDSVEALSSDEAISKIRGMGYFPTKVREKGGGRRVRQEKAAKLGKTKRVRGVHGRVKGKALVQFTRQLSTLQDAGLPILRSLRILEEQQKPGTLKNVARAVANDVEGGSTLSEAMAKYPRTFDDLYSNMVAAGEAGGVLDIILQRLADFMEKAATLKRKIKGAMIYPICVLTIAFGIVMGIMTMVVPKFQTVFKDFDTELPAVTLLLLDISEWIVERWGWLILIGTPFAIMFLFKLIRMSDQGRYVHDRVNLKLPVVGQLIEKTSISRFCRTLGTLISAGVPILEAINITRDTAGNEVYRRALIEVHDSIRKGETFAEPLRKTKVCDSLVVNMIDVGEETGDLDKMLSKIADNYDEEIDILVGSLVAMLEPILVVGLGGICGFIVVALFMPMVALIENLG